WLIVRIAVLDNVEALRYRPSAGTAALAAGQRIAAVLRQWGVRARVATAPDIIEMECRTGLNAAAVGNRQWRAVRGAAGRLTSYAYRTGDVTAESLTQAWSLRADGIIQNVTV